MLIYFVVFIISFFFASLANKQRRDFFKIVCFVLAIVFPSLLAGYRDETVGHDILAYAVPCFDALLDVGTLRELSAFMAVSGLEPLYIMFNYIVTRLTDDIFWAFFMQQVIVLSLILFTCIRMNKVINAPVVYFLYLLLFFCDSMSANRQVFAVAVIFFSFYYLLNDDVKRFAVCVIIATLLHNSAIFTVVLYFMYKYARRIPGSLGGMRLAVVIMGGVLFYLLFPAIINFLISNGLINSKYERYMNAEYSFHKINLLVMACLYVVTVQYGARRDYVNVLKLFIIATIFILLCGQYNDVATRMSIYFTLFVFVYMSRLSLVSRNGKTLMGCLILLMLVQFCYLAMTTGFSEAIPYTSKRLGI